MKITISEIELFAKVVTIKIEEKTKTNNQKSITQSLTMTTTLMFQHMKITILLLSDRETLAKPITCSKYIKK